MSTETKALYAKIELGNAITMLRDNANYRQVLNHLFVTTPNDLMKELGMLELGSEQYKRHLRIIDALSTVRLLLDQIPEEAIRAKEDLDQLSTNEVE